MAQSANGNFPFFSSAVRAGGFVLFDGGGLLSGVDGMCVSITEVVLYLFIKVFPDQLLSSALNNDFRNASI